MIVWLPETAVTRIVDNSSSAFSVSSNWASATSAADKYGSDYRCRSTAAVSDAAQWTFNTPCARPYALYAWWSQGTNRSSSAPYILTDGSTVNQNQQVNGGKWNLLGTRTSSYSSNTIKLSCWTTAGYVVIADAVRAVPQ